MKTSQILKRLVQIAVLGAALASPVMAQMGGGMGGGGMGGGPGHPGMGRGGMGAGMMAQQNGVRGAQLMTAEERTAQQIKMRAVETYDECKSLQTAHRSTLETRAKEKGLTLVSPRGNRCDMLKARGVIL